MEVRVLETRAIADVLASVTRLRSLGAQRTLVLCDIDNTVLRMAGPAMLGSDQWFRWQLELLAAAAGAGSSSDRSSGHHHAVAVNLQHLQDITTGLYDTQPCEACEPDTAAVLAAAQGAGADVAFLTARHESMRSVTRKQLGGLLGPPGGPPDSHLLMCSGRSKSAVAAPWLACAGSGCSYDAVVFVDDARYHVEDVAAAARAGQLEGPRFLDVIWYRGEDARVAAFQALDKAAVTREYELWRAAHPLLAM